MATAAKGVGGVKNDLTVDKSYQTHKFVGRKEGVDTGKSAPVQEIAGKGITNTRSPPGFPNVPEWATLYLPSQEALGSADNYTSWRRRFMSVIRQTSILAAHEN